jgi:hypothetical protein
MKRLNSKASELWKHRDSSQFDDLFNSFVNDNITDINKVIYNCAFRVFGVNHECDELDEAMSLGLICFVVHAKQWDSRSHLDFIAFVSTKVKYSMIDQVRREGRFTKTELKVINAMDEAVQELFASNGYTPTQQELVDHLASQKVARKSLIERVVYGQAGTHEVTFTDFSNGCEDFAPDEHFNLTTVQDMILQDLSIDFIAESLGTTEKQLIGYLASKTSGHIDEDIRDFIQRLGEN